MALGQFRQRGAKICHEIRLKSDRSYREIVGEGWPYTDSRTQKKLQLTAYQQVLLRKVLRDGRGEARKS